MGRGFRDLQVFQLAYEAAMDIFRLSKRFPPEEKYSLTDQIRRSSRSVTANIAEGYRKRQYEKLFVLKLAEADGEATETQVWIQYALDGGYMEQADYDRLTKLYERVGQMLGRMMDEPEKFAPMPSRHTASGPRPTTDPN